MANTTKIDVINSFHSNPMTKTAFPNGLEDQWFIDAVGEYENEVKALGYDESNEEFTSRLPQIIIKTLGMIMYTYSLTRELSRIEKLNGFNTKDVSMTGVPASKTITKDDLEIELSRVNHYLNKQKTSAYS